MKVRKAISIILCFLMAASYAQITTLAENEVTVNVVQGAEYTLPEEIDGKAVTKWSPSQANTSKTGYGIYTAELSDGTKYTYRVNVGEWKTLLSDDFESYNISAEGEAKIDNRTVFGGKFSKEAYSEGTYGGKIINDNDNNVISLGPDQAPLGKMVYKPTENLKDGFKVSFRTKIKEFNAAHNAATGSHQLLTVNFNNTNGIGLRIYKNTSSTANALSMLYVANKAVDIPNEISKLNISDSIASSDWMTFDIIASDSRHSILVNGNMLVKDEAWKGNMLSAGISDIRLAKPTTLDNGCGTVYVDDIVYSKAIYPTGNAPERLTAIVAVGADGEMSKAFSIKMSDGSDKSFVCRFTVNTELEHSETVDGTVEGLNFTIPVDVTVVDGGSIIKSIDNLEKNVYVGDDFALPEKVTAQMNDGTLKSVEITWDREASTETAGTYAYTGYVDGYGKTVTYTLTVCRAVIEEKMINIGDEFILPDEYKGLAVNWGEQETVIDTSCIGRQTFRGEFDDGSYLVLKINVAEMNTVFKDNMELYPVDGKAPDFGDIPEYGDRGGTSIGDHGKIVYENGSDGNKAAKIYEANEWGDFVMIAPDNTKKSYTISGRFRFDDGQATGSLTRLIVYNEETPQKEVCGIYMDINSAGTLSVGNSVNISLKAGANPEAYKTKSVQIPGYGGEWIDFKIEVNAQTNTYDVIVNGTVCREGCPLNLDGLENEAFKSIKIKRYGQSNPIYFDDIEVTEYVCVQGALPSSLSDTVVGSADVNRTQTVYITMSDGTQRPFEVKYSFDPNTIGLQEVEGSIDGFTDKIPVNVEVDTREIVSIKEDSLKNTFDVYVGQDFVLPSTVTAVMSQPDSFGNTEKDFNILWDESADTSLPGIYVIIGHIDGLEDDIEFTLTVKEDTPQNVENAEVTKELNEPYTLPKSLPVIMESGKTEELEIDWNGSMARTDIAGTFVYNGFVKWGDEHSLSAMLTLTVNPSAVAGINYNNSEHQFKIFVNNISELPKKVSCIYENGYSGFENVVWDTRPLTPTINSTEITGRLETENLSESCDGVVNAVVNFYPLPEPSLEDGLDTAVWPGEYGQYKFPLGVSLLYEPFPTNNSKKFICTEDPDNSGNKVMKYENNPSFSKNDSKNYCALQMNTAKGGFVIAETRIKLPADFSSIRYRLLTGKYREFCVLELYGNKKLSALGRKTVSAENAFPLDEWFTLKITADQTAEKAEEQTYDVYVNGVYLFTAPWYQEPSDINGVGQGICRIDFRNDSDDTFVMYLDDAKLYFLDDFMENIYTAINDIPETASENINLPEVIDGAQITWQSSDENVLSPDGTVTRPPYNEENKKIILTAGITKQFGCFAARAKKEHTITVIKADATDADILKDALDSISLPGETYEDLNLKKEYASATIRWSTSNEKIIDTNGFVYPVDRDTVVELTARVSCNGQSAERKFNVKVVHTPVLSDIQRVRAAMQKVALPAKINSDILLAKNENGVQITWTSKKLSVISSSGRLTRSNASDTEVVLLATFTYNDIRQEKEYSLTVVGFGGGNSVSGGGGGGSKSSYVSEKPAEEVTIAENDGKFTDLYGYEWAKEAVEYLSNKGIVSGTDSNKFSPSREIKREEFVAMAARMLQLETGNDVNKFSDVKGTDWFSAGINAACEVGLIAGISSTEFGAGRSLVRQDMAVILCNIAKYCSIDTNTASESAPFKDKEDIAAYAKEAVDFLYGRGIIVGDDGKMFPQRPATRAETSQLLYKFIKEFAEVLPDM